jgi:hypothetical protein
VDPIGQLVTSSIYGTERSSTDENNRILSVLVWIGL